MIRPLPDGRGSLEPFSHTLSESTGGVFTKHHHAMAHVYGQSEAWTRAQRVLRAVGFNARSPEEIRKLVASGPQWIEAIVGRAARRLADEEQQLIATRDEQARTARTRLGTMEQAARIEIAELDARLEAIRADSEWWIVPWHVWRFVAAKLRRRRLIREVRASLGEAVRELAMNESALVEHRASQGGVMAAALGKAKMQLQTAESIQRDGQLAGALAELEVVDALSRLGDGWHVFHDVKLTATHYLRDRHGKGLHSAQLDHLVVGPGGVFVIETKFWSVASANNSTLHNPFEQIDRAQRLCWVLLKEAGCKTQVRTVIANAGHLPARPRWAKTVVIVPNLLAGMLRNFDRRLSGEEVEGIAGRVHGWWSGR
ncbi:MAG: hypothetical protein GC162_08600 [Planctomycetes bacterium]|nr:hypothetical protein [Planctomycetota bacterium]